MKTIKELNKNYLTLLEMMKADPHAVLKVVEEEAINGSIKADGLEFEAMEILTEVYYFIFGGDDSIWFYDRVVINPYWFENEEQAAEGLNIKEEDLKHCFYIETYFNGFVPIETDFIISFINFLTDYLNGEIINGRLTKIINGVRYVILTEAEWSEYPNDYKIEENGIKKGLFNGVSGTALIPVLIH